MPALQIGLSLLAAQIAIHTQEARGASDESVHTMTRQLALSTAMRTGHATSTTKPGIVENCIDVSRCVAAVRVETGANHVMLIRVIALPSRIRLTATLVLSGLDPNVPKKALQIQEKAGPLQQTIDLSRKQDSWAAEFEKLVDKLFKYWEKPKTTPLDLSLQVPHGPNSNATTIAIIQQGGHSDSELLWRWSWVGAGAVLALGGMAADTFMATSRNAALDPEDLINPGMLTAAVIAGIVGVFVNPYETSKDKRGERL